MGCCNPAAAGAAWFGQDTEDNILQNNLGKKEVQAFLNISIARALPLELHASLNSGTPCMPVCSSRCLYPGSQAGVHGCCCWGHSVPGHQPAAGGVPGAAGARRLAAGAHRQAPLPPQGLPDLHHHGASQSLLSIHKTLLSRLTLAISSCLPEVCRPSTFQVAYLMVGLFAADSSGQVCLLYLICNSCAILVMHFHKALQGDQV